MKAKKAHTPTPWHILGHSMGVTIIRYLNNKPASWQCSELVASLNECDGDIYSNAAFIVRAVNCHEELLKALNVALAIADAYAEEADSKLTQKFWDDRDEIAEAIAKAEGK